MKDLPGPGLPKEHFLVKMSLVVKAVLTSAVTGLRLLLTPNRLIARLVVRLTHFEIAEHPTETMATWTRRAISSWHPAFPCALPDLSRRHQGDDGGDALGGFEADEMVEFSRSLSPFLLLFGMFDIFMIRLIGQEHKAMKPRHIASEVLQ